ncbi:hypothetical protein ACFL42_02780 [Candidatus Omnitrophota bacterium]
MSGELFKVLSVTFKGTAKTQKQAHVTMKSVPEGKFQEKVFHPDDKIDNVHLDTKKAQYSYADAENCYFMDETTFEQFSISRDSIGRKAIFLKEGDVFDVHFHNERPLDISFPARIKVKVIQAPPPVSNKDGSSVYKKVTLEHDIEIDAPQFIKEGDTVEIDPEKLEYIDRVKEEKEK